MSPREAAISSASSLDHDDHGNHYHHDDHDDHENHYHHDDHDDHDHIHPHPKGIVNVMPITMTLQIMASLMIMEIGCWNIPDIDAQ